MVVTRSQGDAAEMEEKRQQEEAERRRGAERLRVESERRRRLTMDPPASPSTRRADSGLVSMPATSAAPAVAAPIVQSVADVTASERPRATSPTQTIRSTARSIRSTTSTTTRIKLAELEAAEKLANVRKEELRLEAELIEKRLAARVAIIREDDRESVREASASRPEDNRRVDEWLRKNPVVQGEESEAHQEEPRTLRFDLARARSPSPYRERSPTPPRRIRSPSPPPRLRSPSPSRRPYSPSSKRRARSPTPTRRGDGIDKLAAALEKMSRPRVKQSDLPAFSGDTNEWLSFKAAVRDSTSLYRITPAENIQRLRSSLKGEARNAVAALLHTATDPDVIMKTLEQCFGRPEVIIDRALSDLRKLPRLGSSPTDLNAFAIRLQNMVCVLTSIDRRGYLHNPLLVREVLDKLGVCIRARWCDYAKAMYAGTPGGPTEPDIVLLSRFLMEEADNALRFAYAPTPAHTNATPAGFSAATKREVRGAITKRKGVVYSVDTESGNEEKTGCPSCGKAHGLPQCPDYKAMNVKQRWEFIKERRICFKCVNSRHRRYACKAKPCGRGECRRPHHSSLHNEQASSTGPETSASEKEAVLSVAPYTATGPRAVLLKMCPVVVAGPRGEASTYALLDEGATVTLVDEAIAARIGAEGPARPLHLHGVNMNREVSSKRVTLGIRGAWNDAPHTLHARTVKGLRLHEQAVPETVLKLRHLRDLPREQVCYGRVRPGILIGSDNWEQIVSRELRTGGANEPAASRTQLGWVVHGTAPRSMLMETESIYHMYTPQEDQALHELVEKHFTIEALGVSTRTRTGEADRRALASMEENVKKIEGGYEVGLPWRHEGVKMPPSYGAALRRLQQVEKRMDASPDFARSYTTQVNNLLEKGYAVPCDGSEERSDVSWFLPHFAVENPNKPGKQRLVFDAAARSYGVSLNDHLLEGPDLLLSLPGVIFRFREKAIAVTADIQEMFLQVRMRPADQPAQQFLWRGDDRTKPPSRYKMVRLIFGAASSPFTAHYVRNHNARLHAATHPMALEAITKAHYMDDYVASYDTTDEAQRAVRETREVHAHAGFTLRGWSSNDANTLSEVPQQLRTESPSQLGGAGPEGKILGLYWSPATDELSWNTTMSRVPTEVRTQARAPSKREALSAVMSVYDPLGLISHYTIRAKIILQSLWRLQIPWDDPIPEEEGALFASWLAQLSSIARLRIPRRYELRRNERVELHVLCDASEQAYAAVAYWRSTLGGKVRLSLVAAKAKVAPKKTQTIPRLELQAAVIGARLADNIRREHTIHVDRTVYWSDSTTVIHWITNDAKRYTPFVAHRLGEIAELTDKDAWRWLPTGENVADDATRLTDEEISSDDRWFQGPSFLLEHESRWPTRRESEDEHEEVYHTSAGDTSPLCIPDVTRFSKYEKLVRATARVIAFIDIRVRRVATRLEMRHIERAERLLMQQAQQDSFSDEVRRLRAGRALPRSSKLYKLDPTIEDGLLRVRGRIDAASAAPETKRPIILDGRHPTTKLLVLREHCAAGHANRERVTNDIRQRYWVVRLRPAVRAVERDCALCRVRRARPTPPATGDLPRARLEPFTRPFTNCGVDYFGPMTIRLGRRREKRWGALFTCLTSRAVHLELVPTLTTDSAIMALRRMAARRGWPRLMYSDNGTNFRGADAELRAAYDEWLPVLREEGLRRRMEWRFIAPGAPNQGGAWERLVRSVKVALQATLTERTPTEEVLMTLLTEAEHSINARPLTHVSVDPRDPEALTPNHFLLGTSTGLPTTGPCEEDDRRAWRASQALADHFWRRWVREYLPTLTPRGEPRSTARPLQVGDVVVIIDGTLPRNTWPKGIVTEVYPGRDGGVRNMDIRTTSGVLRRSANKVVRLHQEE